MKKRFLLFAILIIVIIFSLIPFFNLSASSSNLIQNGDFSDGLNHWGTNGNVSLVGETVRISFHQAWIFQGYPITSDKNIIYSVDIYPETISSTNYFLVALNLYKNGSYLNTAVYDSRSDSWLTGSWGTFSMKISDMWFNTFGTELPDFSRVAIYA